MRIAIEACAACRTDLHVVDGELPDPMLPIVPGHQIAGVVDATGEGVTSLRSVTASAAPGDLRAGRFDGTAVLSVR